MLKLIKRPSKQAPNITTSHGPDRKEIDGGRQCVSLREDDVSIRCSTDFSLCPFGVRRVNRSLRILHWHRLKSVLHPFVLALKLRLYGGQKKTFETDVIRTGGAGLYALPYNYP